MQITYLAVTDRSGVQWHCFSILAKFVSLISCRELAIQIAEQFSNLGSDIGVRCAVVSFSLASLLFMINGEYPSIIEPFTCHS